MPLSVPFRSLFILFQFLFYDSFFYWVTFFRSMVVRIAGQLSLVFLSLILVQFHSFIILVLLASCTV